MCSIAVDPKATTRMISAEDRSSQWSTIRSRPSPATEPDALTPTESTLSQPPLVTLQRVWAAALAVLVVLSWRLWTPQLLFSPADFPRVPLVTLGQPLGATLELLGIVGL